MIISLLFEWLPYRKNQTKVMMTFGLSKQTQNVAINQAELQAKKASSTKRGKLA